MKKRALINASLVLALAILASTGWWVYSVAGGPARGGSVSTWTLAALAVGGILGAALVLTSSVLLRRQVVARRRAGSALRTSEIRYRRLFEAAQDGVLLIDPLTQKIIDANPFISQLLSTSREDILGREARQIGLLQDAACRQLQATGYLHYEDLPVQARSSALAGGCGLSPASGKAAPSASPGPNRPAPPTRSLWKAWPPDAGDYSRCLWTKAHSFMAN
jgi:PAS domain-containing protein